MIDDVASYSIVKWREILLGNIINDGRQRKRIETKKKEEKKKVTNDERRRRSFVFCRVFFLLQRRKFKWKNDKRRKWTKILRSSRNLKINTKKIFEDIFFFFFFVWLSMIFVLEKKKEKKKNFFVYSTKIPFVVKCRKTIRLPNELKRFSMDLNFIGWIFVMQIQEEFFGNRRKICIFFVFFFFDFELKLFDQID